MAKKVQMEILGLSASQSQSGSFALVLGEKGGNRRLPIIIGMFEAQAIAIEIEKITPNRPMTHDLFKAFAYNFNFKITEILISDLREGVFFAKIVCDDGSKILDIDARPSDAIAIGLRFNVPIYATDAILQEAGIVLTDEPEESSEEENLDVLEEEKSTSPTAVKDISTDQLKEMLKAALEAEDYEKAAKIRDEINKRN